MGLFNKLGRHVEQFKQRTKSIAEGPGDYQCAACDARFHTEYDECPACGSRDVTVRTTTE